MEPLSLLWLRRDLRLHDHAALHAALKEAEPVQPVFIFDTDILSRFSNPEDRRLSFIAEALCGMDAQWRKRGGGLLVLHGSAKEIMPRLAQELSAARIVAAQDYEPATRARDEHVASGAPLALVKDHLIHAPDEVLREGKPYRVYTPYARAWREKLAPHCFGELEIHDKGRYADANAARKVALAAGFTVLAPEAGPEKMLAAVGYRHHADKEWKVSDAKARLKRFMEQKASRYDRARDFPAEEGTSRLSPYLRFGLLSVREACRMAEEAGAGKWLGELIWREFFAMILFHWPESARTEWNPQFRGALEWRRCETLFNAWREGRTGYPLVDAAMRELLQCGWMHNRSRMVVASFLTKDLRIDWRKGEEHFAQYLMDYDLASNVGGWQWAASTGTDAQPWFRIFNPVLQSRKFDPRGEYIRRFVPELARLPDKDIHMPPALLRGDYPAPVVEHASEREKTLSMFKQAKAAG